MSEYRDPRDLSGPERTQYLAKRGFTLLSTEDGSEVSLYGAVHIHWTSTVDTRIALVIDAMDDAAKARLVSAYAHKGGCYLAWDGTPPVQYREGEMVDVVQNGDIVDSWIVDRSFDCNPPPAELPNLLVSLPYDLYLETDHWKRLREKAIAHYGDTCVLCDRKPVQVHHRTYARRGFEQLTDLIVLCDDCHSRHHGKTA